MRSGTPIICIARAIAEEEMTFLKPEGDCGYGHGQIGGILFAGSFQCKQFIYER